MPRDQPNLENSSQVSLEACLHDSRFFKIDNYLETSPLTIMEVSTDIPYKNKSRAASCTNILFSSYFFLRGSLWSPMQNSTVREPHSEPLVSKL